MWPISDHDVEGVFLVYVSHVDACPILKAKEPFEADWTGIDTEYELTWYGTKTDCLKVEPSYIYDHITAGTTNGLPAYLKPPKQYDDYASYKANVVKDTDTILEELYHQALDKDRFEKTRPLVEEANRLDKIRCNFKTKTRSQRRHYQQQPEIAGFYRFFNEHPEIQNPFDIRCHRFYYEELINDPDHPEIKMRSTFVDAHPELSYDEYCDYLGFMLAKKKEWVKREIENEMNLLEEQYAQTVTLIKKDLLSRDKVGLVAIQLALPRRVLEKAKGSIENYTIDDFLQADWNVIYWFTK